MLLKLNQPLLIEEMQHYSPEHGRRLRELLLRGANAASDPARKDFYDVEDESQIYYIHICPSGKVLLLAVWPKAGVPLHATAAHMAASAAP